MRTALLIVGALLQVGGFAWALTVATHALGDEYAEYGVMRKVWRWFAYWLGPPPAPQTISGSVSASLGITGSLTGHKVTTNDIERLEQQITYLRAEFEQHREAIEKRVTEVHSEQQQRHGEVVDRIETIEARERQRRYEQLRRERYAALMFLVGVALTTAGALI